MRYCALTGLFRCLAGFSQGDAQGYDTSPLRGLVWPCISSKGEPEWGGMSEKGAELVDEEGEQIGEGG